MKNLDLVGNLSLGLARSLPEVLHYDTPEPVRGRLAGAWQACRERFDLPARVAAGLLRKEGVHAG